MYSSLIANILEIQDFQSLLFPVQKLTYQYLYLQILPISQINILFTYIQKDKTKNFTIKTNKQQNWKGILVHLESYGIEKLISIVISGKFKIKKAVLGNQQLIKMSQNKNFPFSFQRRKKTVANIKQTFKQLKPLLKNSQDNRSFKIKKKFSNQIQKNNISLVVQKPRKILDQRKPGQFIKLKNIGKNQLCKMTDFIQSVEQSMFRKNNLDQSKESMGPLLKQLLNNFCANKIQSPPLIN